MTPFVVALLLSTLCWVCAAQSATLDWLLDYRGRSTNALIWDHRTDPLLRELLPPALAAPVRQALSGPPGPVETTQRPSAVAFSACEFHYCPHKAFVWVDLESGGALGADYQGDIWFSGERVGAVPPRLTLGSLHWRWGDVPEPARVALRRWMLAEGVHPETVTYLDRLGVPEAMPSAEVVPVPEFVPTASGPSFDCATAGSPVEEAICHDAELAQRDLDLSRTYAEVWHGLSTAPDRAQLERFQRDFIRRRERDCGSAEAPRACLLEQYARQITALGDWTPSSAAD